jgi:hypothetical protein
MCTLKVFVTGDDQERVPGVSRVIERYDGFVVVEASEEAAAALQGSYLIEDITDQYAITLPETRIETSIPRIDARGRNRAHPAYKGTATLTPGSHHYLVQFIGPIKPEWLDGVRGVGAEIRAPQGDFTYVVNAASDQIARIAALPYVRWTGHLPFRDRVSPTAREFAGRKPEDIKGALPRTLVLPGTYKVEFFSSEDMEAARPAVEQAGWAIISDDRNAALMVVRTDSTKRADVLKQLDALSSVHGVSAVREQVIRRPSNDVAAQVMQTTVALGKPAGGLGLSGEGEIIGVCDTGLDNGDPKTLHPDFEKRVAAVLSYPINRAYDPYLKNPGADDGPADLDSGHGTHVAGSVLGSGKSSEKLPGLAGPVRGLAFKAKLVFQAVEQEMKWKDPQYNVKPGRFLLAGLPDDLTRIFQDAYSRGARIHSNSWGGGDPGAYDDQCRQLDDFVWRHPDFTILVAAGNDGTDNDGDGVINPTSVTAPGTAKNCITVGACENRRPAFTDTYGQDWPNDYPAAPYNTDPVADNPDQVVAFSSRGPTSDGRIKPDVVAPGTYILSTRSRLLPNNHFGWGKFGPTSLYMFDSGTSMATPLTAGAVAVVRQYLRKKRKIASPTAALIKAALIAGAARLPGVGGQLVPGPNDQGFGRVNVDAIVAPPAPASMTFLEVAPGLGTGKIHQIGVTIRSSASPLRVVMAYSDFPGPQLVNNLNLILRGPGGLTLPGNQPPGGPTALDAKNNVEVIEVAAPAVGVYTIEVIGANVPQGPQPFALAYTGDVKP